MPKNVKFNQASYLSQVRRLRALAQEVLAQYSIKVKTLIFIKHGANAIFRAIDTRHKSYLLRINPHGYHTKQAISEEIQWLNYLSRTSEIQVPKPFPNLSGGFITLAMNERLDAPRFAQVFEWIPGHFKRKSINDKYAHALGETIAKLQLNGKGVKIKHRHYWDTEGLVGSQKAMFHNVDYLSGVTTIQQKTITRARCFSYSKLKQFQKHFPHKLGLIHGDLHPNNFIYHHKNCAAIDFDDCGIGFYGYDLAVVLFAFEHFSELDQNFNYNSLREALLKGYAKHMPFDDQDADMAQIFLLARKLTVLGWLESRKENPRLLAYFKKEITRTCKFIKAF